MKRAAPDDTRSLLEQTMLDLILDLIKRVTELERELRRRK